VVVPRSDQAAGTRGTSPGGSLGDALKNIQRYLNSQSFDNPQGGTGQFGPAIQFDTKGVEFGPWVRRFIAQIKRNWFVPYAAMTMHGHVVLTFNVHKDGSISDLTVLAPSDVESFNHAAYNALLSSNPTQPLPPEYPADKAFFTVTFYYNETPSGR
jgi:TonB family protein